MRKWITARTVAMTAAFAAVAMSGCSYFESGPKKWSRQDALVPISDVALSDDLDTASFRKALGESLAYYSARSPGDTFQYGPWSCPASGIASFLQEIDRKAQTSSKDELLRWLAERGTFLRAAVSPALATGYYEAELNGARKPDKRYRYPLYRRPKDLLIGKTEEFFSSAREAGLSKTFRARVDGLDLKPYFSREEIDYYQKLAGRGEELLWVDDPIEAFFLQIQGSGVVKLPDGTLQRVNYAEANGHAYKPIANWFLANRVAEKGQLHAGFLKEYLRKNPDKQREIFVYNPSYVFFREVSKGPLGNIGKPLTPGRSIATDHNLMPGGALAFLETEIPILNQVGGLVEWIPARRLVFIQDTGGAIKGPGRLDLFMGTGEEASHKAGYMNRPSVLTVIVDSRRCTQTT